MPAERWGALSVKDHSDAKSLATQLLLYDRLIIPVPWKDKESWDRGGWKADLLRKRIEQLGDLATQRPWNPERKALFENKMREIRDMRDDARDMLEEVRKELPYQLTRRILAAEPIRELPEGVTHVDVVCAYQSAQDLKADFVLEPNPELKSELGLLFAQRFAVPEGPDPEDLLTKTIDIAKDGEFRKKRRAMYEWQIQKLNQGYDPRNVLEEMTQLVKDYNDCAAKAMKAARINFAWSFAYTLGSVIYAVVQLNQVNLYPAANALIAIVQFVTKDLKPVITPGEAAPAAMFYDIQEALGLKFSS